MLKFVLLKLLNKKWMVLALLIGNILLVSVAASSGMYTNAALQRSLNQSFTDYLVERNVHPCMVTVETKYPTTLAYQTTGTAKTVRTLPDAFGVPASQIVEHYYVEELKATAVIPREDGIPERISVGTINELEDHIEIVAGRMYASAADGDGVIDVIVSEQGLTSMHMLLEECFTLPKITDENGEPIVFRVCGVFRSSSATDVYWAETPDSFTNECLMDDELFHSIFQADGSLKLNGRFYVMLDYTSITTDQVAHVYETAQNLDAQFADKAKLEYADTFQKTLSDYIIDEKQVTVALWVLQVPIFVLLAAFIFMVSRQMLDMEQNEIAVLKSRGASRLQIISVYLMQSALMALIALIIGIPLGSYLVQVLGSANEFLEFVNRSSLPLKLDGKVLGFSIAAALLSVCTMVLPVFRHSKVTIVNHMQRKHRKSAAPTWQRLGLDVILLGLSLYGLYTFNNQKDSLAAEILNGGTLDPMLFICSSLFMLGSALLALRIIPAIIYLIFRLFKRWWSPALYTTFLQLIRTRHSQTFIVVFLIMTMALGIFNSQTARTINTNAEENSCYNIGADIVLQEKWRDNLAKILAGAPEPLTYYEPDYSRYEELVGNGAATVTQVLISTDVSMTVKGEKIQGIEVMSIDTPTFGPIVWMKDGLLNHHLYEYLNAMTNQEDAVLLSRNFQTELGIELGDSFYYYNVNGESAKATVYGFFDYWPTYNATRYEANANGTYDELPNYLIVSNIDYIQGAGAKWSLRPYQVWIDAEDSTDFIYDFVEEESITLKSFRDTSDQLIRLKNDPLFQGTNGVLTVGFVVVLILCSVGFLIYWILSIRSRSLQFGIYRAMGMSMGEVLLMLFGEQLFISCTSIAAGALVGALASKFYIPLIQIAYTGAHSALPLNLISESSDITRLLVVVGAVMLVCMVILGWLISKLKITQALKLGED